MADRSASLEELAQDRVSGATELARRAAQLLRDVPRAELPDVVETILRGHPSMAPLWRLATEVLSAADPADAAARFHRLLATEEAEVAVAAAALLPDRVLTLSYSSMVLAAIRLRRPASVVCMTSFPGAEGRLMASALAPVLDAQVIADEDALERVPADAVVVGADAVTPTSVINKVKTRELAEAAARAGVPFYVVAGGTKLVADELPVTGAFEETALRSVTGVVTAEGLLDPEAAREGALRARLHPALRLLIPRL